jgi:hypothetical protein
MGNRYEFGNEVGEWTAVSNQVYHYPDAQIIPQKDNPDKQILFYTRHFMGGGSSPGQGEFEKKIITAEDGDITFGPDISVIPNNGNIEYSSLGFVISNYNDADGTYTMFLSTSYIGDTQLQEPVWGLMKFEINEAGDVQYKGYLLNDYESDVFTHNDFKAYNLEMQDKNNVETPIIAWITTPSPGVNSKIYLYNDTGNEYYINLNKGAIAGIEFSPFQGEEDYMYVCTQNSGVLKLNYVTQQYTVVPGTSGFTHSFVQTAPDGNIYVVSDDGNRLGRIDRNTGLFNDDIFTYQQNYVHNAYTLIGNVKYYTLPENDKKLYNLYTNITTTEDFCHECVGTVDIIVIGGVPDYSIEVTDDEGSSVTDHFTLNQNTNTFHGENLCDTHTYTYMITDSDTPSENYTSSIYIENGNSHDFGDILVVNAEDVSNLPEPLQDLVWDQNDFNNNDFLETNKLLFEKGFIVAPNTTLHINGITCEFDLDAKLIIKQGAENDDGETVPAGKLVLNNATLSNYTCDPEFKWAGVEVWGNKAKTQTEEYQGKLEMYNSTIEHAHEAVQLWRPEHYNTSGGMIYAENSQFLNNRRAVSAISFENWQYFIQGNDTIGQEEMNYHANFKQCIFENDENYIDDNPFYTFVTLWAVKGVSLNACNLNSGYKNGNGIYTINAGFSVAGICSGNSGNGCTNWDSTKFYNFDKAISANNTLGAEPYPINIQHSYFYNNNFGACLYGLQNVASVKTSEFVVGNNGETKEKAICGSFWGRGIHIEASTGFTIENNAFYKNTEADLDDEVIGIYASNNPSNHDIIYHNTFTNLKVGNQAVGNNRFQGTDPNGIEYQCNENTNNKIDFEVIGDENSLGKIHPNMGLTDISAHNKFTSTSFADLEWQWRNMGMEQENYYISSSELGTDYVPDRDNYVETTNDIATLFVIHNDANTVENQCSDNDGIHDERLVLTSEEQQDLETEFAVAYNDYQSVESIYNDLKDGGSTEGTSLSIASAQPGGTWELRDNLLGKSPYLSREILEEAANKTDVLPNSVLLDILAANPDELKQEDFIQYLENKEEPLPNYMIDILRELSTGATYKTVLVNQMALYKRKQIQAANRIIKSLINEEEQNYTAIKNWLANKTTQLADMQIAGILMNEGNFADATAILNLIPETYNLQDDALNHYLINKNYMLMEINLKQNNRSYMDLTDDEIAQLEIWADGEEGMARSSSRIILENFYGYDNYCDCVDRGGNKSANANEAFKENQSPLSIEANPNPATHYVEFTYQLSDIDKEGIIMITDMNGKQIQSFTLKYSKGIQAWDTRKVPAGSYVYTLKTKYFEKSAKLIINH